MADLQKIVDDLSSLTVLEAAELAKLLEEKWGVSAAAAVAVAGPGGWGRGRRSGRREDRVHGRSCRRRRQEDRGHQGSPRHHRPGPEGSKGPRRGRAEACQGRREQGRSREAQGPAREGWREGRAQVSSAYWHEIPVSIIATGISVHSLKGWARCKRRATERPDAGRTRKSVGI